MAKIVSPLTGTLQSIKKQFIGKEKLLKSSVKIQKKRIDSKRQNAERERFINYEKVLERSLSILGRPLNPVSKKMGFLESLKTFIVNVLLGFITLRLLKYLPQLSKVFVTILKVGNFILDTGGKILNGLVSFVDNGYKAYDHARNIVGKIGGEKAITQLDKLSGEMNSVMNSIFIAGMLFSDFSIFGGMASSKKSIDAGVDAIQEKIKQEVASKAADTATKTATRAAIGPLGAAGIVLGVGLLSSALGEGIFQIKKFAKGLESFGPLAAMFRVPITILSGVGTLFDIIGTPFRYGIELIRAAVMKLNDNKKGLEEQNKNLGKFDARIRENIREFSSFFAPLFTFFGRDDVAKKLQTPGSFGSLYGQKAVKDMGYNGGGKVIKIKKFADGGVASISVGRTEDKKVDIPRKKPIRPMKLNEGSVLGGEEILEKVFSYTEDSGRMNPYKYITNSYYTIARADYLGPVMSLTMKALVGDLVTRDDYSFASENLGRFMLMGLYEQSPELYNKFYSLVDVNDFNRSISRFLLKSMGNQLNSIVNLLRIQVGLAPIPGDGQETEADACAAACDGGAPAAGAAVYGDAIDKAILDLIASVEQGPEGYDSFNVSGGRTAAKATQVTVDWLEANARGAIGRYQHMPSLFKERVIAAGFKGSDKFTAEVQDKTTLHFLYTSHSYQQWRSGQMSDDEFGNRLSATWRGLPHSSGGTYPDEHAGRNKAHISRPAFMARLAQIKAGGMGTMAKIAPGSPASNVSDCICDPETPDGNPGDISGDPGPGGGNLRFGRTGSMSVASGWSHAHFDTVQGTPENVIIKDTVPLLRKMASSGLKPELANATPILAGKSNDYYVNIVKNGIAQHTHRPGPRFDVNMPGFPLVPFPLTDVRFTPSKGEGVNALVPGSGKTALFHLGTKPDGTAPSRETGGPTFMGGIRLLHKGEYVIDKDSVDLFGGNFFFNMINGVENERQRSEKSSTLIQHLSRYTGRRIDQDRPTVVVDEKENYIIQSPPTLIGMGYDGGNYSGGINEEQDILELA